jgi:vitamin K-dependent gamma-carboxylase
MITRLKQALFTSRSPEVLALFRIGLGILLFWEVIFLYRIDFIQNFLLGPDLLFNYKFFPLEPISEGGLEFILGALAVSAVLITVGLFTRVASGVFFLGFSYLFLLDKGYYNNHLYLFCLIAFLMLFVRSDETLSIRAKLRKIKTVKPIAAWQIHLLQFQVIMVYFFGGIAKLNSDWMVNQEPARTILAAKSITSEFAIYFVTYAGTIFDLAIGFLLLTKKTLKIGIAGVLIFNITNAILFDDINIFPFFMLMATVLFLHPDTVAKWVAKLRKQSELSTPANVQTRSSKLVIASISVFVLIQLWLPLRHLVIPGNVEWTGEGQRFAWRMKIQTRTTAEMAYRVWNMDGKQIHDFDMKSRFNYLNADQINQMQYYPEMMLDYAHFLGDEIKKLDRCKNVAVRVFAKITINGSDPKVLTPMETDLYPLEWNTSGHNKWINPVDE